MKYCYQCGRMTNGEPLLLQPLRSQLRREALSANAPESARRGGLLEVRQPRVVNAAAEDSDELAIACHRPAARHWPRTLFYASLSLVIALLHTPEIQRALIALGMLLACLWWLWSKLPDWLQELIRALWKRKENKDE